MRLVTEPPTPSLALLDKYRGVYDATANIGALQTPLGAFS